MEVHLVNGDVGVGDKFELSLSTVVQEVDRPCETASPVDPMSLPHVQNREPQEQQPPQRLPGTKVSAQSSIHLSPLHHPRTSYQQCQMVVPSVLLYAGFVAANEVWSD